MGLAAEQFFHHTTQSGSAVVVVQVRVCKGTVITIPLAIIRLLTHISFSAVLG